MSFLKYAKATLQKPDILFAEWDALRQKAVSPAPDFQKRTAKIILQEYDPSKYMLSHATIVASVDVENSPAPLGKHFIDGFEIDRKYSEYYITPKTSNYINNNGDSFERKLLLATYKTFIGAFSYVEHVQIPELAKGRIIDAAARDVGDSIYVDILIANELKHAPLIRAIKNGQLGTLSMGCFIPGSQVTMADGTRVPIEEVSVGDAVLTHKGRAREVTNKQIRIGHFSMKRIEVSGVPSSIVTTRNHPFFVLRNPELCACGCGEQLLETVVDINRRISRRFRSGHQLNVYNPNKTYSSDEAHNRRERLHAIMDASSPVTEVQASELRVGDLVCFPRVRVQEARTDYTIGKARLLGYFLAEGSFLKRNGKRNTVQFNFSMSEKDTFAAEVVKLLRQEFPNVNAPWIQERPERNTFVVSQSGSTVAEWFFTHGGEYSHLKRLSIEAMKWPVELHRHLLSTWINGDGTLEKVSTRTSSTTTSYALACQLHQLFSRCGIFVTMFCNYGGRSSEVREVVNGGVSMRSLSNGKLAFFTLGFNRDQDQLLECTKVRQGKENKKWRMSDDFVFFPVRSIEDVTYEGPVHDMEVEEDHSYIVEGVAVHNCSTSTTTCSKCGNVALDETQLCKCVRFFKGSEFADENKVKRKVAELCGNYRDQNSVKFIEASWVANPAFKGAVLRSILSADELKGVEDKMHMAFNLPPTTSIPNAMDKAAYCKYSEGESFCNCKTAEDYDIETTKEENPADAKEENPAKTEDAIQKAVADLAETIRTQAIEQVRKEITQKEVQRIVDPNKQNESLIRSAMAHPEWRKIAKLVVSFAGKAHAKRILNGLLLYKRGRWSLVKKAGFSGREILALSRVLDLMSKKASMAGENRVYRAVLSVGGTGLYEDEEAYLAACRQALGRRLTGNEAAMLLEKGRLLNL